jgi:hypothetical protein
MDRGAGSETRRDFRDRLATEGRLVPTVLLGQRDARVIQVPQAAKESRGPLALPASKDRLGHKEFLDHRGLSGQRGAASASLRTPMGTATLTGSR